MCVVRGCLVGIIVPAVPPEPPQTIWKELTSTTWPETHEGLPSARRGRHNTAQVMMLAAGHSVKVKICLAEALGDVTAERTLVMISASFAVVLTRCSEIGNRVKKRKHVSAWTRRCPSFADEPLPTAMRSASLST